MDLRSASNLALELNQGLLLRLQIWNGKLRVGHLYPERFSRSCEKFSVSLFVIGNPFVNG